MHKLFFVGITASLTFLMTACGTVVRLDNPAATQIALQSTIEAIQGTVVALETKPDSGANLPGGEPRPQIVVVTATGAGETPEQEAVVDTVAAPTPTATKTLTPVPTATHTASPTIAPPADPVIIVVTATPASVGPRFVYDQVPLLTEPRTGAVVEENRQILLRWSWNDLLGPNEYFDVKIRPEGQGRSAYVAWERAEAHDFRANLRPGRYLWSVQVIRGTYRNDSGEPEDRLFEAFVSPESASRVLIVDEKPRDNPRSISQAEPPAPDLPYGLLAGIVIFGAFVGLRHELI